MVSEFYIWLRQFRILVRYLFLCLLMYGSMMRVGVIEIGDCSVAAAR
jgi:hypothetical protein